MISWNVVMIRVEGGERGGKECVDQPDSSSSRLWNKVTRTKQSTYQCSPLPDRIGR